MIFRSTRLAKLYRYELYGEDFASESDITIQPTEREKTDDKAGEGISILQNSSQRITEQFPPPLASTKSVPYYNFNVWNDTNYHTKGFASIIAFCCGVVGAVMGMNQVYYTGPIAKLIGEYAADMGTFLAIGFAGVSYPLLRYAELKRYGK